MDGREDASPSSSSMPIGRPEWTSQRAFILASVASVVGLGNLWRFPYMAGENGGGTFIVAYVICIFSVGLPLFILETSAGSMLNRGPVGVFRRAAGRLGPALGWSIVLMVVVIMSYYFVVTGWTLGYFVDAVLGNLKPFDEFTSGYASLWWFLAASVLVFIVLRQGTGSVEQLGKVFMPLLWPALVTTGLLAFIGAWNEFLFALTFTISETQRTVPVAIALLSGASEQEIPWGPIMAASVIVTVPLVVLVLVFQRKIVAGLTAGGVKG